jgi:hypothetical protein
MQQQQCQCLAAALRSAPLQMTLLLVLLLLRLAVAVASMVRDAHCLYREVSLQSIASFAVNTKFALTLLQPDAASMHHEALSCNDMYSLPMLSYRITSSP